MSTVRVIGEYLNSEMIMKKGDFAACFVCVMRAIASGLVW